MCTTTEVWDRSLYSLSFMQSRYVFHWLIYNTHHSERKHVKQFGEKNPFASPSEYLCASAVLCWQLSMTEWREPAGSCQRLCKELNRAQRYEKINIVSPIRQTVLIQPPFPIFLANKTNKSLLGHMPSCKNVHTVNIETPEALNRLANVREAMFLHHYVQLFILPIWRSAVGW